MRSLSTAGTGMLAQQTNVDVISHNIANMNTTGYKRQRAQFQDLLYQNVSRPGSASGGAEAKMLTGIQVGAGVRTAGIYRISEQGARCSRRTTATISASRAAAIIRSRCRAARPPTRGTARSS